MPFHRPIPDSNQPSKMSSGLKGYVEAEKLMQIAMVMPAAVAIGWAAGYGADHLFNTHWLTIVGIILGCVSGLVYVIQVAVLAEKKATRADAADNDSGKGNPPSAS
jgi:F0F1-type ATP synthase assembly protein I